MKGLKIVTVGNSSYLCVVEGRKIKGIKIDPGKNHEGWFRDYFKQAAMGQLLTMDIGEGKDIVTFDLTESQKITFAMVESQWAAAKQHATGWLVTKVFEEMFAPGK